MHAKRLAAVYRAATALLLAATAASATNEWTPRTPSGASRGVQVMSGDSLKVQGIMAVGADSNVSMWATDANGTAHAVVNHRGTSRARAGIGFKMETYSIPNELGFRMYHWGNGPSGSAYGTPHGYTIADTLGRWGFLTPGYPDSTVSIGGGISASGGLLLGGKVNAGPGRFAGDVRPAAGATYDLGASGTQWDSVFAHHALVVGDMPHYDDRNDLALIRAIKPSPVVDRITGAPQVDDATVPREILALWRADGIDTVVTRIALDTVAARVDTVVVPRTVTDSSRVAAYVVPLDARGRTGSAAPVFGSRVVADTHFIPVRRTITARGDTTVRRYRAGDPILDPDGKPYIDLTAAHGLTMGAVRQLAATDDSLRSRTAALEERVQALEVRLARTPAR
jgi:hypothetical protein